MTQHTQATIDRMVETYKSHGENGGAYLLVALTVLAGHAPDVVEFALDRADQAAQDWAPGKAETPCAP